jgi:hypothetical protein
MEWSPSWKPNSRFANQETFATKFFSEFLGFDVLTLVTMKSKVFWDVTSCSSVEFEV